MDDTVIKEKKPGGSSATSKGEGTARTVNQWLWAAALRNEISKTVRRPAALVISGLMLLIAGGMFGNAWWEARHSAEASFALPAAWSDILGAQVARPGLIFGSLLIVLLVASEFSWRTARQNVIDGLSKAAWFQGKVFVLLLVGAFFLFLQVATGVVFAVAGTESWSPDLLPGIPQLFAMGGILTAFLGYGGFALFVAFTVRSPGPSVGVWFLYMGAGERLLAGLLGAMGSPFDAALRFLPINVFNGLVEYELYHPATDASAGSGQLEFLLLVTLGWIVLFIGGSFLVYRGRDL